MNCYYCGSIIDEEKNICTRCGKTVKEIHINLDSLIINKELSNDDSNKEIFDKVTDDIIEKINSADKKEKSQQEKKHPKKVVVKVKQKNK